MTKRIGWREITAVGDGVRLATTDVPTTSSSAVLTKYPEDLLSSPPDQRRAHLRFDAAGDTAGARTTTARDSTFPAAARSTASGPRGTDRFTAAFTGLVARQRFTLGFGLLALVAAVALGALHALAPGHGKTVMAAYLVGERGSLREAAVLGLTVTSTHTAGVLLLGILLSGSTAVIPEELYPWLGLTSGAMLAGVGVSLLVRAWRRRSGGIAAFAVDGHHRDHHHGPGHHHHGPHHHGADHHDDGQPDQTHAHSGEVSRPGPCTRSHSSTDRSLSMPGRARLIIVPAITAALTLLPSAAQASNDPLFAAQWSLRKMGAAAAWERTTGAGVRIGIVDTGVDLTHEDLAGKVVTPPVA